MYGHPLAPFMAQPHHLLGTALKFGPLFQLHLVGFSAVMAHDYPAACKPSLFAMQQRAAYARSCLAKKRALQAAQLPLFVAPSGPGSVVIPGQSPMGETIHPKTVFSDPS